MSAFIKEQYWRNGRLHRVWWEQVGNRIKVTHERLIPPDAEQRHAQELEALRFTAKRRAQLADGLHQVASFTPNEREALVKAGVKLGDTDGLKWALKQDRWRHAKVGS